jgi:hypothetical protein
VIFAKFHSTQAKALEAATTEPPDMAAMQKWADECSWLRVDLKRVDILHGEDLRQMEFTRLQKLKEDAQKEAAQKEQEDQQ